MVTGNQIKTLKALEEKIQRCETRIERDMKILESSRAKRDNIIASGAMDPERLKKRAAKLAEEQAEIAKVIDDMMAITEEDEVL